MNSYVFMAALDVFVYCALQQSFKCLSFKEIINYDSIINWRLSYILGNVCL